MKHKAYRTMEIRADDSEDDKMIVEGYAAVYGQRALMWESDWSGYKYYEEIEQDAFNGAAMDDVIMRYNHADSALILARTRNNTLQLIPDAKGLRIRAEIADTTAGRDIYNLIKRGDIDKMSFAFIAGKTGYEDDEENKEQTRKIMKISQVVDVAPVDFPAYDGTSIGARNHDAADEFRKREDDLKKRLELLTY